MDKLLGDDGGRPPFGIAISVRSVNGKLRVHLDRVRREGDGWIDQHPSTFRDFDGPELPIEREDCEALGAFLFAELEASLSRR